MALLRSTRYVFVVWGSSWVLGRVVWSVSNRASVFWLCVCSVFPLLLLRTAWSLCVTVVAACRSFVASVSTAACCLSSVSAVVIVCLFIMLSSSCVAYVSFHARSVLCRRPFTWVLRFSHTLSFLGSAGENVFRRLDVTSFCNMFRSGLFSKTQEECLAGVSFVKRRPDLSGGGG